MGGLSLAYQCALWLQIAGCSRRGESEKRTFPAPGSISSVSALADPAHFKVPRDLLAACGTADGRPAYRLYRPDEPARSPITAGSDTCESLRRKLGH